MQKHSLRMRYTKTMLFVLVISFLSLIALTFVLSFNPSAKAESIDSDLHVNVNSVLELALSTCNSSNNSIVEVNVEPTAAGTFKSNCQTATVNTNAPGYSLSARATGSNANYQSGAVTNSMLYMNPTTMSPFPSIPATANTIAEPAVLANETWGFAVEGLNPINTPTNETTSPIPNFDASYAVVDNASNKYAALPTTDTTLYHTTTFPLPETEHKFYYATKLTPSTVAGSYATTVTYTAIGAEVPPIPEISCVSGTKFKGRVGTMQNASTTTASWQIGDNGIATDTRNNQDYCIRKMEDDKVWMITNLKLDGTSVKATRADGTATLTPQDTNIAQNFTIPDAGLSTTNVYKSPMIDKDVATPGAKSDQIDINAEDFYGYYYNWCAAKAGTSESCTASGTYPTASTYDICPVGWRLPTGSSTVTGNDFAYLNGMMAGLGAASTTNNATTRANWLFSGPFRGVLSGYRGSSSWVSQGFNGSFWSGSFYPSNSANAFGLNSSSSSLSPGTGYYGRFSRLAVRCLLQP